MIGTDDGRALGSPCGVPPSGIPAKVAWCWVIPAETTARHASTLAPQPTALTDKVKNTNETTQILTRRRCRLGNRVKFTGAKWSFPNEWLVMDTHIAIQCCAFTKVTKGINMKITKSTRTVSLLIVGIGLAVNGYSQPFLTNGVTVQVWGRPVVSPGVWTFCRLNESQSRRDCISQPRVARGALPWVCESKYTPNPERVASRPLGPFSPPCRNHWPGFSSIPSSPPKTAVPRCATPRYGKHCTTIWEAFSSVRTRQPPDFNLIPI